MTPSTTSPIQHAIPPFAHQHLVVEWRHLEVDGVTCVRCSETGKTLQQVIADLAEAWAPQGIEVTFTEIRLNREAIAQSNQILFNGVALEDILAEVNIGSNACGSCSQLTQQETYCRTVEYEGNVYAEVPETVIQKAALKALELAHRQNQHRQTD
jgi:Domain of unknown function (DUF2703)